jgi:hypothetical protein
VNSNPINTWEDLKSPGNRPKAAFDIEVKRDNRIGPA